jgi:hypothetical protein
MMSKHYDFRYTELVIILHGIKKTMAAFPQLPLLKPFLKNPETIHKKISKPQSVSEV